MPDAEALAKHAVIKPGEYLRLRREAAGLTFEHIVVMLRPAHLRNVAERRGELREELHQLEAGTLGGHRALDLADLLGAIFSFDPSVYHELVARAADPESELPLPQICRGCGCTWNDACVDAGRGACSWARPDLCSHCVDRPTLAGGAPTHAA